MIKGIPAKIIFVIVAFAIIVYSVVLLVQDKSIMNKHSMEVEATVISYETITEHDSSSGSDVEMYAAVYEYRVNGRTYKETTGNYYEVKDFEIGEKVTINYIPSDPSDIIVMGGYKGRVIFDLIELGFGLLLFISTGLNLLRSI